MNDPTLGAGSRLGHFTVIDGIGAGGMGEVYRAFDERLKREVVLKVLPRALMDDAGARTRLVREARSAAALNHPHICTVFDVAEDEGQYYIAMELVTGQALDRAVRAGGLSPAAVVRIGSEIADALEHAHAHGVIHRDLKSANVMLTSDGRAKVMDFGIARRLATAEGETAPGTTLTEPGAIVGTTHYMPPEVLMGGEASVRGDIWALGVVLHEMAAGELPFDGHSRYEVAAAIMHADPRPLPDNVPAGLRAVIGRCLEKEPGRRYQHAGEVRAALEAIGSAATVAGTPSSEPTPRQRSRPKRPGTPARPLEPWQIAAIAISVVVVAGFIVITGIPVVTPEKPADGLAVLPLENLSRDPEQAYFADGMTEEISTRLAQIAALRVIAQTSVSDLVKKHRSLPDIGRALRVPVLLRGSVLLAAGRVRITVQLIRASTGDLMWAQSYERNLLDVLALQSEVALAIARQVQVKLTPQEHSRLAASRQIDPEAYQAYLKGRAAWNGWNREAYQEAERQFRHAIELAPDYAPAWSGLADALYGFSNTYLPPNDAIPRAREAAQRALALDETLAEAHTSIGIIKMVFDWDWAGAEQEFDRAIALKPGDANAHLYRGRLLVATGRSDDGLAAIRKALDLDPLSSYVSANLAWFLYYARRNDQALVQLRRAMSADPDYGMLHFMHGLMLEQAGDHSGAVAELEESVANDVNPESVAQLSHGYATAGRRADAERTLARLLQMRAQQFVPAGDVAYAYAGLGEKDKAFQQLDSALVDHSEILTLIRVDPGFDPLRSDPRFDGVLRRIGLTR